MFCDIKNQLDNPDVLQIVAYSEYESLIERAKKKAAEFRRHKSWQLYGWVENGEIGGVYGFEVHKDFEYDRDGYTDAKGAFIRAVTEKAKKL